LLIPICLDERPVSQVYGKPNHELIAEGHYETTYVAKCEWRQMMEDRWLSVENIAAYLAIKRETVQDLDSGQSSWEKAKSLITKIFEGN